MHHSGKHLTKMGHKLKAEDSPWGHKFCETVFFSFEFMFSNLLKFIVLPLKYSSYASKLEPLVSTVNGEKHLLTQIYRLCGLFLLYR